MSQTAHQPLLPGVDLRRQGAPHKASTWWHALRAVMRVLVDRKLQVFLVFAMASLAPPLMVDIPVGFDIPNHVARMGILAQASQGAEHPYYEASWAPYPNLAMDLIVPQLAKVLEVEAATRCFYLSTQVLVVSGAIALEVANKQRMQLAGYAAVGMLYSFTFAWGFMNFNFGLGCVLWSLAFFVRLSPGRLTSRLAVHACCVLVLAVTHLFALGLYGFVAGLLELHRLRRSTGSIGDVVVASAWMSAPLLPLMLLLTAGGAVGGDGTDWSLAAKPLWFIAAFNGFEVSASLVLLGIGLTLALALGARGALSFEGPGRMLAVGLVLLFLVTPWRLLNTALVDVRVVVAAALILPAFTAVRVPRSPRRTRLAILGCILITANLAHVAYVFASYDQVYDEMRGSFELVEPGSKVLIGAAPESSRGVTLNIDHVPTLAAYEVQAFLPTLFADTGKQPLVARPSVRGLTVSDGEPIPLAALTSAEAGLDDSALPDYARDWFRDFDYLYLLGAPPRESPSDRLEVLHTSRDITLYRIHRDAAAR